LQLGELVHEAGISVFFQEQVLDCMGVNKKLLLKTEWTIIEQQYLGLISGLVNFLCQPTLQSAFHTLVGMGLSYPQNNLSSSFQLP
jgi:hypothetical protein